MEPGRRGQTAGQVSLVEAFLASSLRTETSSWFAERGIGLRRFRSWAGPKCPLAGIKQQQHDPDWEPGCRALRFDRDNRQALSLPQTSNGNRNNHHQARALVANSHPASTHISPSSVLCACTVVDVGPVNLALTYDFYVSVVQALHHPPPIAPLRTANPRRPASSPPPLPVHRRLRPRETEPNRTEPWPPSFMRRDTALPVVERHSGRGPGHRPTPS